MKRITNYYLLLPILLFATGTCIAQTASTANDIEARFAAITPSGSANATPTKFNDPEPENSPVTAAGIEAMPAPTVARFDTEYNKKINMLTVKTECAGKVYFYTLKGRRKGACFIHEGTNQIFMESLLNPGEYLCKFEGTNGSTKTIKVKYKPGKNTAEYWLNRIFKYDHEEA